MDDAVTGKAGAGARRPSPPLTPPLPLSIPGDRSWGSPAGRRAAVGPTKTFAYRIDEPSAGTAIFRMEGRLRGWPECFEFQEAVRQQVTGESKCTILDMEHVEHVDSTGVGILAAIYTSVQNAGGRLILACMNAKVQRILDVLWFLRILEHTDSVDEALKKLSTTACAPPTEQ
jgi:anti-anti-sigma factor